MGAASPQETRRWRRVLLWALLLLMLASVFLAYTQPALMMQLSEQLWACF
jgi:type II secretory pathway component PulM